MVRIESDIGSRDFESSGPMKQFTVEDAGEPQQVTAAEVMAMRQRKIQEHGQVSDSARRRIEMLVGIGRATVDVPVDGRVTYSLRTLKGRETKKTIHLATELSETKMMSSLEASYALRDRVLAYSIYAIDGVDIDTMLNITGSEDDRIASRVAFLEEQDDAIISYIYDEYGALNKRNKAKFSVKTEEEVKEVAEQMTKSGEGVRA